MPGLNIEVKYDNKDAHDGKFFAYEMNTIVEAIDNPLLFVGDIGNVNDIGLTRAIDMFVKNNTYKDVSTAANQVKLERRGFGSKIEHMVDGSILWFTPAFDNTGNTTLQLWNYPAKIVQFKGKTLTPGDLKSGTFYGVMYDNASDKYEIKVNGDGGNVDIDWSKVVRTDTENLIIPTGNPDLDNYTGWVFDKPSKTMRYFVDAPADNTGDPAVLTISPTEFKYMSNRLIVKDDVFTYKNSVIWHSGNDGDGSGLDADKLDGLHASAFWKLNKKNVSNIQVDTVTKIGSSVTVSGTYAPPTGATEFNGNVETLDITTIALGLTLTNKVLSTFAKSTTANYVGLRNEVHVQKQENSDQYVYGDYLEVDINNAAAETTVTDVSGRRSSLINTQGTVSTLYGTYDTIKNDSIADTVVGNMAYVYSSGVTNVLYGYKAYIDSADTVTDSSYLFYGSYKSTTAGVKWGMYIPTAVDNYFGGYLAFPTNKGIKVGNTKYLEWGTIGVRLGFTSRSVNNLLGVSIGRDAGGDTVSVDTGNVLVGDFAGLYTRPINSTCIGEYAGFRAGPAARRITNSVLLGNRAGVHKDSIFESTVIGYSAGGTGTGNRVQTSVLIGSFAGSKGAYGCVAIGHQAGQNMTNTDGDYKHSGYGNNLIGYQAGNQITTGDGNDIMGYASGIKLTTGGFNTIMGYNAGRSMTIAADNVCIGTSSGSTLINGTGNVFVGKQAGQAHSASNSTAVGRSALYKGTSSTGCVAVGYCAGQANTSGTYNTYVGYNAGSRRTTGANGTFIGKNAGDFLTAANHTKSNMTVIGNKDVSCNYFHGTVLSKDGGGFQSYSDRRVKNNIEDYSGGLDVIRQLEPVTFKYVFEEDTAHSDDLQLGLIAQDVEKAFYEAGYEYMASAVVVPPEDTEERYTMNYPNLVMLLINANKELDSEVTSLSDEVKGLRDEVKELKEMVMNLMKDK